MRERSRSLNSINGATDFLITPTMQAPLETSLVLRKGTGDPTWSRATKAWGFNELGYLEELASGCAFFGGARLVRNTVRTTSEDFSNAAWTKNILTVTGTNTIVCANATSAQNMAQGATLQPVTTGQSFRYSVRLSYIPGGVGFVQLTANGTGFGSGQYITVNLITGAYNAVGCVASVSAVNSVTFDVSFRVTAVATGVYDGFTIGLANSISDGRFPVFIGDGIKSFELLRAWSVDVTNYDTSYIPEYVSVGVEASPYFGAGIDGAKYFSTDYTGGHALTNLLGFRREAAATNNLLMSRDLSGISYPKNATTSVPSTWVPSTTGSSLVANGVFDTDLTGWTIQGATSASVVSGKMRLDGTSGGAGGRYQAVTTTIGKTYLVSATVELVSGSGTFEFIGYNTAGFVGADREFNHSGSASATCNFIVKAKTTVLRLFCYVTATRVADFDNITVTEVTCVPELGATGIDGIANTATILTATAADATILHPTSGIASAARCASAYIKRRTGTGDIFFTQDGGSTWTDITSQINSSTWSRVQITSTLANPSVGFKISTSGDAIDVDVVQNEAGAVATSPIVTTTTAVTRNVDSLTYQTSGNWSDTVGTAYAEVTPITYSGGAIGSATNGLLLSTSNSGATAFDGTNAANGPTGTPGTSEKLALNWTGAVMEVASSATVGTPGTYNGAMGLSNIGIGVGASGYFKNVAVYPYALSDADMVKITT